MLNAHQSHSHKWNWLDFCFIVFLLALIAALLFRFDIIDRFREERGTNQAEISISLSNLTPDAAQALQSGTTLWIANEQPAKQQDRYLFGSLQTVKAEPAKIYLPSPDGQLKPAYSTTNIDVYATLNVDGKLRENGFYLQNAHYLAPGLTITLQNENRQFEVLILDVLVKNT